MCIVSLFSRLGLPLRTSIFIVIFLLPLLCFSADIFIINPCESHVNPRSAEWIISMIFLCSDFGEWWLSPELSAHCIHSSCVHNVQSLLGVNLSLDFGFSELFSSVYLSFLMFGVIGAEPLSSYVSKHSILKNCNAEIPCLLV